MFKKGVAVLLLAVLVFTAAGCNTDSISSRGAFGVSNVESADKLLAHADDLAKGYFYDEAVSLLQNSLYADRKDFAEKITQYQNAKGNLKEYTGTVYHIFFHSLIVYPELAFDGDSRSEGYDLWMTTVAEFKAMLPQLKERGFVLYPITALKEGETIYLPEGKKPLIISVDDVSYYDYMADDGFAEKLVINDDGDVVTQVKTPEGETVLTYDGDVMPILDQFVKENPDFSYRGAKGVLALTGYQGALGYRITDLSGQELEDARAEVLKIAKKMKENGWLFASHSYTHNEYFKDSMFSLDQLKEDTQRWLDNINDYLDKSEIYISPFGYHLDADDERMQYLVSKGFHIFCPVGTKTELVYGNGVVIQERFNLDRYNMRNKKDYINDTFFDVDSVF